MAKSTEAQGSYYASTDGTPKKDTAQNHKLATIKADKGSADVTYYCTANLAISLDNEEENDMAASLQQGDAFIKLAGSGVSGLETNAIDLESTSFTSHKTQSLSFTLTGTTPVTITGDVYVVNKETPQDDLVNKNLKVTVTVNNLVCDTAQSGD